jgi:hypothetical protein
VKIVRFEATRPVTRFDSRGATIGGIAQCRGVVRLSLLATTARGLGAIVVEGNRWSCSSSESARALEPL